jgi:hypothetical protein
MAKHLRASTPRETETLSAGESVLLEPTRRVCQYVARLAEQPITPDTVSRMGNAVRALRTLLTYGIAPGPDLPREVLETGRNELANRESPEIAEKAFLAAGELAKGRPVMRRHVAAKALEAKLANPHLKRRELARQFCPCGKTHTQQCANRLRRDMQRLNALIRQILRGYPA